WGASGPMTATAKGLRFDLDQPHTAHAVLAQFGKQLHAVAVQFGLASSLAEHYQALGGDAYDVIVDNRLAAVVDMRGDVALSPRADCTRFGDATWQRRGPGGLPGGYHHTTVSELMWLYATRTTRDLLPPHYRTRTLFYRRPPRVPQRLLGDSHLKVLRELSLAPTTFDELSVRTKIPASALARALAALHFVGGVTSNPRRACPPPMRPAEDSCDAVPVSMNHSMPFTRPPLDATAPATLSR
ncbi:hypothetical protein, partial [Ramlibacter sp.]|uniref:DprA-like winged helix domain-containing protein n=1 Tax=Ramlibacter sp. TaxID=1917967 RepID=UPI003D0AF434